MPLTPIRTPADHKAALKAAERLFDLPEEPDPDSERGAYFEALITLVDGYERKHFPIAPPNPIAAIKWRMEQQRLSVRDLAPYIGQPNRVYEVLSGKRPLTLRMIRNLHRGLGIPAETLLAQ